MIGLAKRYVREALEEARQAIAPAPWERRWAGFKHAVRERYSDEIAQVLESPKFQNLNLIPNIGFSQELGQFAAELGVCAADRSELERVERFRRQIGEDQHAAGAVETDRHLAEVLGHLVEVFDPAERRRAAERHLRRLVVLELEVAEQFDGIEDGSHLKPGVTAGDSS